MDMKFRIGSLTLKKHIENNYESSLNNKQKYQMKFGWCLKDQQT